MHNGPSDEILTPGARFVTKCCGNPCFGDVSTPKGLSRTVSRRESKLRRRFDAEGPLSYGNPSGTYASALFSRRKARSGSNHVQKGLSCAVFSPERPFEQRVRL